MIVTAGSTDVSIFVYFVDDVSGTNTGEPTTGLLFSDIETGGSASYCRQGAARTDFTLVTLASASAAHTDGGFILVDDTNMPGLYRLDIPDAAVATGVDQVVVHLVAAAAKNTVMRPVVIDLTDVDLRDNVRGGMTALPNAAADAAGGLPISDAGGLDMDAILVDTGTTLENHLTDIKGTGFVKDTHSLTDIEAFVDLIDDGTSGLAKIATDVAATLVDTNELQTDDVPGLIAGLNDPTAAAIADAVWDEDATGHQTGGTFGQAIGDPGLNTETMYDAVVTDAAGTNIAADIITVDSNVDAILMDTGTTLDGKIDALNDISVSDILTTQMTEAYAADGTAPTLAQALFAIMQQAGEFAISGTTITVKKLDGSTTAMTFTLDDATNPTSRTRAT